MSNFITTDQNVRIDYKTATLGQRVGSTFIDYGIFAGYFLLIFQVQRIFKFTLSNAESIILILVPTFYHLIMEQFFNGQSVGKKILKLQVVSLDGTRPTFGAYIMRWMFRLIETNIMFMFGCIGITSILMSKRSQRIGDMVAGTIVINLNEAVNFEDTIFTEIDANYNPSILQAKHLKAKDIQLIQDMLRSDAIMQNHTMMYNVEEKLKQNLQIHSSLTGRDFLETLIKDYNYYQQKA